YKNLGVGISTENLWWGPGKKNSLLMSNNARGFSHITFRSLSPVNIEIGHLEWQMIGGRLEGSGFPAPQPSDPVRPVFNSFRPFEEDWRYLNAFTFTYQPKWIPGMFLGMSRAVQQYSENVSENGGYFPIFINFFRENDEGRDESEIDQLLSLHFRWVWYEARAEVYFEYGRNDASLNLRDFLMSPRHSRAFIFGMSKIFDVSLNNWVMQVSYEHTHMEQSNNFLIRDAGSWYLHSTVRHGYTNRGEVLGAGIGPGSNYDYFEIALVDGIKKIGFEFERLAHNQDFFYAAFRDTRDWRRFWIDYTFGLSGS
ncbi:MAG: capsule assembly Wzi family protein, partial [Bacteroidota bacterium]